MSDLPESGKLFWEARIELRDWFAGMALFRLSGFPGADEMKNTIAAKAYEYADAMLEARKK